MVAICRRNVIADQPIRRMTAANPIQPKPKAIRAGQREGPRGAAAAAGTSRAMTGLGTKACGRGGATGIAAGGGGGGGAGIGSGSGSATSTIASGSGGGAS